MPDGPMTGRAEFTLGGPLDNLADRLALGLTTLGVRPGPGARLRSERRTDDLPMLTDSMSHIPAWARKAAGGAVGSLPFGIVTIVQRERSRSWSVELLHLDGYRLSARVGPVSQTPTGVVQAVEQALARVSWSGPGPKLVSLRSRRRHRSLRMCR